MNDKKCSKCSGEMKKGNIADRTYMNIAKNQAWSEGDKAKVSGKSKDVAAYCCEMCGFIELYAEE